MKDNQEKAINNNHKSTNTMGQYCIMHHKITHYDFDIHVTPWDYVSALIELFINRFYLIPNTFRDNG